MSSNMLAILTLGQLIADRPCRAQVLSRFGIEPWCHGRKNLPRLCAEKAMNLNDVLQALQASDQSGKPCDANCARAVLPQLIDHIEATHHAYTRQALPNIHCLISQTLEHDAAHCPRLPRLRDTFATFQAQLHEHLAKEERILFAACRNLAGHSITRRQFNQAMQEMLDEHGASSHSMESLRTLADDYTPPPAASPACHSLYGSLRNLEDDLHRHVFEENNILTPLALALAKTLA